MNWQVLKKSRSQQAQDGQKIKKGTGAKKRDLAGITEDTGVSNSKEKKKKKTKIKNEQGKGKVNQVKLLLGMGTWEKKPKKGLWRRGFVVLVMGFEKKKLERQYVQKRIQTLGKG